MLEGPIVFEDIIDQFVQAIFVLFFALLVGQHQSAEFFPCIQHALVIADLPSKQFLYLVRDAFAYLVILVDVPVVDCQGLVAFC